MNLEETFPVRFLINLGRRSDKRARSEAQFIKHSLAVERIPAIDRRWLRHKGGFDDKGRYALALTQRLAIRAAKRRRTPAVLLFEDDVFLHPELRSVLSKIELPPDWGIFYLGCAHTSAPAPATPGLVRVTYALDTHAIAIRASAYDAVLKVLKSDRTLTGSTLPASDRLLARLHSEVPSYAVFPNLAWQRSEHSDLLERRASNYTRGGEQVHTREAAAAAAAASFAIRPPITLRSRPEEAPAPETPLAHPAFLFLLRDDVNHPVIWHEYLGQDPNQRTVLCHSKNEPAAISEIVTENLCSQKVETYWGTISLVRATLALVREALHDAHASHFILCSESCVPIRPLNTLVRDLSLDRRSMIDAQPADSQTHPDKLVRVKDLPTLPKSFIHFHSQWIILCREDAEALVSEDLTHHFESMFAPDECYFATALALLGADVNQHLNRTAATWTKWTGGAHPQTHDRVSDRFAADLSRSGAYFARKFSPDSNIGNFRLHCESPHGALPEERGRD